MDVKIRFNTDYSTDKSPYKWRIIIDDVQHLVDEVEMKLPTYTTGDLVQNQNGTGMIMKWHISCKAKNVSFKTKKNLKIAVVL